MSFRRWLGRASSARIAAVLAFSIGAAFAIGACGEDAGGSGDGGTLGEAQEAGSITVGVANEKPFGFVEGGELKGFAPDVARAILSELGVDELDGVVTQFDGLIPGLQANRYDMIAAGMAPTIDRCKAALFSNPFFTLPGQLAVEEGNPLDLQNLEDVAARGASVGALAGSTGLTGAEEAGIEDVQTYPDVTAGLDALRAGRIDAFIDGTVTITPEVEGDNSLDGSEPFFVKVDGVETVIAGSFTFRPGEEEFVDEVNAELKRLQESGEILEMAKAYGFGPAEIESAEDFTAEELCETVEL